MQEGGLAGLTCVQDVWQDSDYTELTVLTGLLHHVFTQDLTQKHSWEMPQSGPSSGMFLLPFQVLFVFLVVLFFLVTLGLGLRELHQPPGVQEQGRYQRTDPEPAQWCRSGCGLLGSLQAPPLCGRSWWWGILGSTQSTNLNSNCLRNKNQVTHSIKNSL